MAAGPDVSITLLDPADRLGGVLRTERLGGQPLDVGAEAFVAQMRNQITGCPDQDASVGTEVTPLFNGQDGNRSVSAWRLETEIGEDETISYDVAVVRRGTAVAQVVYVAAPGAEMTDDEFVALAFRAQERLRQLPPYRGSD